MYSSLISKVHEHHCKRQNVQNSPTHDIIENSSIQPYPLRKRPKVENPTVFHLQSLSTGDIIPVLDRHTLGHVVDLVDTDKSGSKLELENKLAMSTWKRKSTAPTILFLNEITMNWAFFVRSLMYEATMETFKKLAHVFITIGSNPTHISEVQGSIDLVHDIERSRFVVVKSED